MKATPFTFKGNYMSKYEIISRIRVVMLVILVISLMSACASNYKKKTETVKPGEPTLLTMPLGNAELKTKFLQLKPGDIYLASTGQKVSFDEMIDDLASRKVVFLGESHTSMNMHKNQDRIIRALYERNPKIVIGMEFFQREHNEVLKDWSAGKLSEEELLYKTEWYSSGGYNFGYYRPFIAFAKEKGLKVEGMNIPRTVLRMVSRQGLDKLPEKEKEMVGEVIVDNKEHKELIMKYFGGAEMGHGGGNNKMMQMMLDKRYAAQCVWDNVFADSILNTVKDFDGIYVVIVGSGHTAYNLGANRRLSEKADIPQATVFPVDVEKGQNEVTVARSIGDYIICVKEDSDPPYFPELGVSAADKDGKIVIGMLFPDSESLKAGFKTGDQIISLDGVKLKDATQMRMILAEKKWGDKAVYKLLRAGKELEIVMKAEK